MLMSESRWKDVCGILQIEFHKSYFSSQEQGRALLFVQQELVALLSQIKPRMVGTIHHLEGRAARHFQRQILNLGLMIWPDTDTFEGGLKGT